MKPIEFNTDIATLGEAKIDSPLKHRIKTGEPERRFVDDESRIVVDVQLEHPPRRQHR